jgi:hypothetical protein
MARRPWLELAPSLLLALGIILSAFVAVRTASSGWPVLAGPLALALAVVGADLLTSGRRTCPARISS